MSRQEQEIVRETVTERSGPVTTTESEVRARERVEGPVTWEEMRALLRREPMVYERTWRPTTAGILAILSGVWNLLAGIGAVSSLSFISDFLADVGVSPAVVAGAGGPFIALGIIGIIGGSYAISRRVFGMALTGSIAALFGIPLIFPFIMGTLSLIFVSLGHLEFKGTNISRAMR